MTVRPIKICKTARATLNAPPECFDRKPAYAPGGAFQLQSGPCNWFDFWPHPLISVHFRNEDTSCVCFLLYAITWLSFQNIRPHSFQLSFLLRFGVPSDLLQHSKAELPETQGFKHQYTSHWNQWQDQNARSALYSHFLPINEHQPPQDTFKQYYHQHPVMIREQGGTQSHRAMG